MRSSSRPLPNRLSTFFTAGGGPLDLPDGSICARARPRRTQRLEARWRRHLTSYGRAGLVPPPTNIMVHRVVKGTLPGREGMRQTCHLTLPSHTHGQPCTLPHCALRSSEAGLAARARHRKARATAAPLPKERAPRLEGADLRAAHQVQRRLEHQAHGHRLDARAQPLHLPRARWVSPYVFDFAVV